MLHKLLSMDERFQVLENWLVSYPMARPPRDLWAAYSEYQRAVEEVAAQPESRHASHFVGPDEADECLWLVAQTFVAVPFGQVAPLPDYDEWMMAESMIPSLRRHADNLRLIGADQPQRPWLLKNPSHLLCMDEMFEVYPGLKVVWTHRDPKESMGSLVKVLSDATGRDPVIQLRRESAIWAEGIRGTEDTRADHKDAFFDIDYRSLVTDPVAGALEILDWFGLDSSPEIEARMQAWLRDNPQGKHGEHRYDPNQMAVTDYAIREMFGSYISRYALGPTGVDRGIVQ
jgi:hypothetical protein